MKTRSFLVTALAVISLTACGMGSSSQSVQQTSAQTETAKTTSSETASAAAETSETSAAAAETTVTDSQAPEDTQTEPANEETSEPNGYGFYRVTSAPPTGISIAALEGEWINGGQYLVFHDCDLYEGEYVITEDGMITYEGKVYIEYSLNPDDTKEYWYDLYTYDDEFVMGFGVSGEIPLDDLYAGQSGEPHFTREVTEQSASGDEYIGVWGCGRITIVIEKENDDYIADISWAASAAEYSRWHYVCRYDEDTSLLICDGGATKVDSVFDESGNETLTDVYNDGTGSFELRDGSLIWTDDKENMGDDIEFLR